MSYKKSFLVTSKILGLLINKLTADYEYSRSNKENLPPPIYMQLPKKPKTFCVVIEFLESTLNLEHFEKKNESHSSSISEIIDSERRSYVNVLKCYLRSYF